MSKTRLVHAATLDRRGALCIPIIIILLCSTRCCLGFAVQNPHVFRQTSSWLSFSFSSSSSVVNILRASHDSSTPLPPWKQGKISTDSILMHHGPTITKTTLFSSFAADGSEYSSKDKSDFDDDDDRLGSMSGLDRTYRDDDDEDDSPTIELQPVPLSKNAGNRFVVFVWDRELNTKTGQGGEGPDALDLHYDRIQLTEDHVMFCRKANLYNETHNTESMVDVLWSLPILASDLKRLIGHAMILESTELSHVQDLLSREPVIQMLTGGRLEKIPLYRWRHIRDYTLRIDDGRFGYPCMCLAMDDEPEQVGNLREELKNDQLEYLIRSERVIAAGPLHLPTQVKDDPSSIPVGDLILFNAENRDHAVDFCENLPAAQEGLYRDMRVHFYNNLDITGKFVSEDPLRDAPCSQMKEALEVWGYPVADSQTPWLNW